MSPLQRPNGQEQAQIAAYLEGEMIAEEVAAFERRMSSDRALSREVDQWRQAMEAARDWVEAEAPGVERVESLPIPSVFSAASPEASLLRLPGIRPALGVWRWLAIAAVFVAGFLAGHLTQSKPSSGEEQHPAAGLGQPAVQSALEGQGHADSTRPPAALGETAKLTALPGPARYSSEENGRLIIETTLRNTGARAMWVVDGTFGLTQSKGGSPS